ncbi:MAG: cytidine deaminase [Rubrimonas sp.]
MDELLQAATTVRAQAHAPYSNFAVGAALRTASGRVFAGANVECASYPEGWCAETSAIAAMVAAGEREIVEVVVAAEHFEPVTPCGGCRQRLAEFGSARTVVRAADATGERARWTLGDLLPVAFGLRP